MPYFDLILPSFFGWSLSYLVGNFLVKRFDVFKYVSSPVAGFIPGSFFMIAADFLLIDGLDDLEMFLFVFSQVVIVFAGHVGYEKIV